MKSLPIYIAIVLIFLISCDSNDSKTNTQLDTTDALINDNPDSALSILKSIHFDHLNTEQKARYALLINKAKSKKYISIADDSIIHYAVNFFSKNNDSLFVQSLYYQGEILSARESNDSALVSLNNAYDKALDNHDLFYAAISAREIAAIYCGLYIFDKQLEWALTAKQLFKDAGKPVHASWMDIIIINAMTYSGKLEEAEIMCSNVDSNEYKNNNYFRYRILLNEIEIHSQKRDYKQVLSLYDCFKDYSYSYTAHDMCKIADALIALNRYDEAKKYQLLAQQQPKHSEDSLYLLKIDHLIYAHDNNYIEAYKSAKKLAVSIMISDEKRLTKPQTLLLHDNLKLQIENEKLLNSQNYEYIKYLIILCVAFFIIILLMLLYLKTKSENRKIETEKFITELSTLHDDLIISNQALTENQANYTTELRNLFITHTDLLDKICNIWYRNINPINNNDRFHKEVTASIKKLQNIDVIESLTRIIDIYNDNWISNFKNDFQYLKTNDYILAMYLYIGFRPETIAVLMNKKTTQAVYIAKHKLKQKITAEKHIKEQEILSKLGM